MRTELYYSYISGADVAALERLVPLLPPNRQAIVAARRDPADRAQAIAVTALLQHALTAWERGACFGNTGVGFCTVPAAALTAPFPRWECDRTGRPFPAGLLTAGGRVWVSLSHSGGHLLVAVSDRPVGADIQGLAHPALASHRAGRLDERIRHPAEPPAATPAAVAARWAAKEAAVKLTGEGLSRPFCHIQAADDRIFYPNGQSFSLFQMEKPSFVLAVAVKASIPAG